MSQRIVECVPNFSEGRDLKKIELILDAAREIDGVEILDVDPGQETNRTVVTLVGSPESIEEAAVAVIGRAAEVLDMSKHQGAHARHGATDVCPFVPVSGVTMAECIELAKRVGKRVGENLGIPVYLYDQAAQRPERQSLAKVRAGEYEALPEKLAKEEWKPDFGPAIFNPKAGVVTIGAREFLIAYNINLNSARKDHADDLAHEIREKGRAKRKDFKTPFYSSGKLVKYRPSKNEFPSAYSDFVASSFSELETHYAEMGRDLKAELKFFDRDPKNLEGLNVMKQGQFKECRGVGWVIPEYNRAQLSFNLLNYKVTSPHDVLEASREMARERGLGVTGSEIVGMIPFQALQESGEFYLKRQGSTRGLPVNDVLECAVQSMGLRDVAEFEIEKSVLGMPSTTGTLSGMRVNDLADEVSRPTPAPGGGSIAALAGALGAALATMVANLTFQKKSMANVHEDMEKLAIRGQRIKDDLLRLIDADTDAFTEVIVAMRLPKTNATEKKARLAAIEEGYKSATRIPFKTAQLCLETMDLCLEAAQKGLAASLSDAGVGAMMARSACLGAIYNVKINLGSINDQEWINDQKKALGNIGERAEALEKTVRDIVEASF
ncbi:MAG: glutamate formiminotransferase/formiminotetrahydrofolate cyclodeaminase [Planctomycetota bacterium]|jgi:glutamate formiminotransferase/formiminotetrahydrofolate cyclodeaminase